jgi:tRNA G37 N-methylase TrmD
MLIKAEPVALAIEGLVKENPRKWGVAETPVEPVGLLESHETSASSTPSDDSGGVEPGSPRRYHYYFSISADGKMQRVDWPRWRRPETTAIVFTEPSGIPFKQENAKELAQYEQVVFVCGHYEGIDHRAEETYATHVFSIGDYVLTNGELPALVMADAITRLLPGVLGAAESLEEDSFSGQGLSAPNYTKPPVWRGREVPDVLRSGDHKKIDEWRRVEGETRTRERRPDLLP